MKYGLNLLLWTDRMHDGMTPIVERVKALGYDGVEVPIFDLNEALYAQWGRRRRRQSDQSVGERAHRRGRRHEAHTRLLSGGRHQNARRPDPLGDR
jgi:sugar phosphate isomerase/epimerase